MSMLPTPRRAPARSRATLPLLAVGAALALTGCSVHQSAAPAPLQVKGQSLPTRAGPVRLNEAAYRGRGLAVYQASARYFRWPLLVPAVPPRQSRLTGAVVSRFFAGSFAISARAKAQQVPGSYVPGNPVAPAAYQLRLTYQAGADTVTLFEAVHPYVAPKGATRLDLPGSVLGGQTWQAAPGAGLAPLRYVQGHLDGLYLMAYGPAKSESARALAAFLARLRAVAVPPGKAPVATVAGNTMPVRSGKASGAHKKVKP